MPIRALKMVLLAFVAVLCLVYAAQNLVNLQAAHGFVAGMSGMVGHEAYPERIGPAVTAPLLTWSMLGLIIALELAAGVCAAKGACDLWRARRAPADAFHRAKQWGVFGCGLGIVIWFGIFSAIGGAYFQMWQIPAGAAVLENAFWFSAQLGIILLVVNAPDA